MSEEKKKARFSIEFEVSLCLTLEEEISVDLPDASKIILHATSSSTNTGEIILKLDKPDFLQAHTKGREKIRDFLRALLIATNSIYMKELKFKKPRLLNEIDFSGEVKTGFVDFSVNCVIARRLESEKLFQTSNILSKVRDMQEIEQDILYTTLFLYEKGCQSEKVEQFIFWWISFESLVRLHGKRKDFLKIYLKPASQSVFNKRKKVIEALSNMNLIDRQGNNRSEKLREKLHKSKSHYTAILIKAVYCIAEIRNKLLHEGEMDVDLIYSCALLLADIICESIKEYLV